MCKDMGYKEHQVGIFPLYELSVGLVSSFVLEYMHFVCLGTMYMLIYCWLKGPLKYRQSIQILTIISAFTASAYPGIARKPKRLLSLVSRLYDLGW